MSSAPLAPKARPPRSSASPHASASGRSRSADRSGAKLSTVQVAATALFAAAALIGVAAGGGALLGQALALGAAQAGVLAILLLAFPDLRRLTPRLKRLWVPGLLLAGVVGLAGLSLTPFAPGGVHPVWAIAAEGLAPDAVMGAGALDRSAVLVQLLLLGSLVCAFVSGRLVGSDDGRARLAFRLCALGLGLYALVGFFIHTLGLDPRGGSDIDASRLKATLSGPNTAGTVFAAAAVMALALVMEALRKSASTRALDRRLTALAVPVTVLAVCLTALVLTASRGALAAAAVAGAGFVLWEAFARRWRSLRHAALAGGAAIVALLLVLWSGDLLFDRLAAAGAQSQGRAVLFAVHTQAFLAAPLFGYGLGSFSTLNGLIIDSGSYPAQFNIHAVHNLYLQWLEETGIVGAALMAGAVGLILRDIVAGPARRTALTTQMRAVAGVSAVFLIHGLSDFALQEPGVAALWAALLGLGSGMAVKPAPATPSAAAPYAARAAAPLAIAGAVSLAVLSALAAYDLAAARDPQGPSGPRLPLAQAHGDAADRALGRALTLTPGEAQARALAQVEAATRAQLALAPASGGGWFRLAYIEHVRAGRLEAAGLEHLRRAFATAPLDPYLMQRRTYLAYQNWIHLDADLRRQTLSHLRLAWTHQRPQLERVGTLISDPLGRAIFNAELTRLKTEAAPEKLAPGLG